MLTLESRGWRNTPKHRGEAMNTEPHRARPGKWTALVDDIPIPMPERQVKATVLATQAAVPNGRVLVRDHNSPDDVVIGGDETLDLAQGNVFYTLNACDVEPRQKCEAPPKL